MELTNEVLQEFIRLNREIKEKTKRLDRIRQACKERGSFVTKDYLCAIETQTRTGLPSLDEVTKYISRDTLQGLGLIRTTPVVSVRIVSRREYQVEIQYP